MSKRLQIYSPLPPEECANRIRTAMNANGTVAASRSSLFGSGPIVGRMRGHSMRLLKRIWYGNSFQTVLTATLQSRGTGTLIEGRFAMHSFVRWFLVLWIVVLSFAGPNSIFVVLSHGLPQQQDKWHKFLIPLGMQIFGVLLMCFGRFLARNEARFLADFLRHTLEAESTNDASSLMA